MALAWLLTRGQDVVPIPGTKRRTYLEQNVAAEGVTFAAGELEMLEQVFTPDAASGERYGASMMKFIDRG